MRILVTGSRDWDNRVAMYHELCKAATEVGTTVVHGACPTGADQIADEWAEHQPDVEVERHPADWERYGKSAGFRRNKEMVDLGADICLAFIKNGSKGASMTARLAEEAGIPTVRYEVTDG